jgi:hypothetical protein
MPGPNRSLGESHLRRSVSEYIRHYRLDALQPEQDRSRDPTSRLLWYRAKARHEHAARESMGECLRGVSRFGDAPGA